MKMPNLEHLPLPPTERTEPDEHKAEKEPKFPTLKIAVCGSPHSGKTVFLSSLVERLPPKFYPEMQFSN